MFGRYSIPLRVEADHILVTAEKKNGYVVYRRKCREEQKEKVLLAKNTEILINPVEPINKPKEITNYLLIHLDTPVVVEPESTHKIYLTFPVAVGVFIKRNRDYDILDIFTLASQKYTLYGNPQRGVICRYWKSTVHTGPPEIKSYQLGLMALSVKNATEKWITVTRAVFNAYGMKIHYSDRLVSMKASMKVFGENHAETQFSSSAFQKDMKKSLELYTVRKLSILSSTYTMMEGL